LSCRVSFRYLTDRQVLNSVYSASKKGQLCITQTLSSIESVTGPLTINKIAQLVPAVATGQTSSLNGVNLCTPCVKQIYNVAKADFPSTFGGGNIASNVQANCGASFVGKSTTSHPHQPKLIDLNWL